MKKMISRVFGFTVMGATLIMLVTGCAQQTKIKPSVPDSSTKAMVEPVKPAEDMSASTSTAGSDQATNVEPLETNVEQHSGDKSVSMSGRSTGDLVSIYFDFDKSNIRDDQRVSIEGNASTIKNQRNKRIRIEGNCDERGSNEYNMALGERRAISAKKYLVNLGVSEGLLDTVSYGEEKPLTYGHDEAAWSLNRRDDFVVIE